MTGVLVWRKRRIGLSGLVKDNPHIDIGDIQIELAMDGEDEEGQEEEEEEADDGGHTHSTLTDDP